MFIRVQDLSSMVRVEGPQADLAQLSSNVPWASPMILNSQPKEIGGASITECLYKGKMERN